ncbi:alpha integrin [Haloferula helveola]|uniref:Alpha integrin n=2 Tax=Haloferula helveola TaxID=490095 RepID=A0ABM7RKE5_9BACT|nr:alpha integrin [Haloferula helveola]
MKLRRCWLATFLLATIEPSFAAETWKDFAGKPGPGGWRCHVIQPDPKDHGPDGINFHDWDGDGDIDVFANYEEGKYSRLYLNPGKEKARGLWEDSIEFRHGPCEDSGIGDLDNDGDIDYVANGGIIYFNPGPETLHDADTWPRITLFREEQRVPVVADVDGDGLNDLIVGGRSWFKQPETGKHGAEHWIRYELGEAKWPMNCLPRDVDKDGDTDIVVADRRKEIFWYANPGKERVTSKWPRKPLHPHGPMFVAMGDIDGDGREDMAIAGGAEGKDPWKLKLTVLLRTNDSGDPTYHEIRIDQPCGNFPKGVGLLDLDGDPKTLEIVVLPKQGDLWTASFSGDPKDAANWKAAPLPTPGSETRKKMDNVYLADLDGDGDLDITTTEENGGWGVIWFENPAEARK